MSLWLEAFARTLGSRKLLAFAAPVGALMCPVACAAGGGAVEAALSVYLEAFATTLGSREQLAIAEAADALLVIPKTLAVNAAKDATELARPKLVISEQMTSSWTGHICQKCDAHWEGWHLPASCDVACEETINKDIFN